MMKKSKPIAFILLLAIVLTPAICFADSYYPNPLLDDMIRLDKWNNSDYVIKQYGNTYQIKKEIDQIGYADDLTETFTRVDDEYNGGWPNPPHYTHYSHHAIVAVHPSTPTAILPVRTTTSGIFKITTSSSIIGNYEPPTFPTQSSLIYITPAAVTESAVVPEYDTPSGISAMFLGATNGDATLFEVGGAYALIDTSGDLDKINLVDTLKAAGIEKLEYLVLTNTHLDKIGGAMDILENFTVDNVILPSGVNDSKAFDSIIQGTMLRSNVYFPDAGDIFNLNGAQIRFLGPVKPTYANTDNMSLVTKVTFEDMDYLLMSDAGVESENDIYLSSAASGVLDGIEVLSVANSGSASGTSTEFMTYVDPLVIVISSSAQDIVNGNPPADRLLIMQGIADNVLLTDTDGTIEILSDGTSEYSFFTSN